MPVELLCQSNTLGCDVRRFEIDIVIRTTTIIYTMILDTVAQMVSLLVLRSCLLSIHW
jgi:hypothetical protein